MKTHLEKHPHTEVPYFQRSPRFVAFDKYYSAKLVEFQDMVKAGGI